MKEREKNEEENCSLTQADGRREKELSTTQ